jgi:CheY-like chemotaxis protein
METTARPTILIVEDEPFVQMLLSDFFAELGYAPLAAGDAQSALILLETRAINLLLADVGLPGPSGRALAAAARKLCPSLPVLFVTGYSDQESGAGNGSPRQTDRYGASRRYRAGPDRDDVVVNRRRVRHLHAAFDCRSIVFQAALRLALRSKNSAWLIAALTASGSNGFVRRNAGSGRSPVRKRSG